MVKIYIIAFDPRVRDKQSFFRVVPKSKGLTSQGPGLVPKDPRDLRGSSQSVSGIIPTRTRDRSGIVAQNPAFRIETNAEL